MGARDGGGGPPASAQQPTQQVAPHDLEAESALLGAMLIREDAVVVGLERCQADDYYRPAHGHIHAAIGRLHGRGDPADPITVAAELRQMGMMEAVGSPADLLAIQGSAPAISSAGKYAGIVADHARRRRTMAMAAELAERARDGRPTEDLVARLGEAGDSPANLTVLRMGQMCLVEPPAYDYVLPGLPTETPGLLVGPGGTGKSRLLLTWAIGAALGQVWPWPEGSVTPRGPAKVLYVTGEDRVLDIQHRVWSASQYLRLDQATIQTLDDYLEIWVVRGLHLTEGLARGPLVQRVCAAGPRRLVALDPLARLTCYDENSTAEATTVIEALDTIAARTGAAVVAGHHVNKAAIRGGELAAAVAARGASGLTDGARWQAQLLPMGIDEARARGIEDDDRTTWRRLSVCKLNYAGKPADQWFSVGAGGVLTPQEPPAIIDQPPKVSSVTTLAGRRPRGSA